MKYILLVVNLLNELKTYFNFAGSYAELNFYMKKYPEDISLNANIRNKIITIINSLEVEKQAENIASIKNPNVPLEELSLNYTIDQLTDKELLNYLGTILWTVSINENENLMLLKYNECIWNTGWHNYAKECRGKIIDKNTLSIVSYPFDKFFNLNENKDSEETFVSEKIREAQKVSLTNKLDGSTIIVSKYNGEPLITTNGAFKNEQTEWAKEIFNEKYSTFINNVPANYTFVFELIHPDNRIIINYGDTKDLYLIAVRDNKLLENGLLSYTDMCNMAHQYQLNIVEQEMFVSLDDLCTKARALKNANKEGWVVRLENNGHVTYMFKLKLEEYFLLHRAKAHISLKNVYNLYITNQLDEFVNTVDDGTKQDVIDLMEDINITIGKIHKIIKYKATKIMDQLSIERENVCNNREKLLSLVKETGKDKLYGSFVLKYVKGCSLESLTERLRTSKFMELYRDINP